MVTHGGQVRKEKETKPAWEVRNPASLSQTWAPPAGDPSDVYPFSQFLFIQQTIYCLLCDRHHAEGAKAFTVRPGPGP